MRMLNPFYEFFTSLYMVKSGFNQAYYLLCKQIRTWNIERADLRLKLTNLQSNIHDFFNAHQTHLSH